MGGDYLKKCQPQIAGEDVLWLVSSLPLYNVINELSLIWSVSSVQTRMIITFKD